VPGLNLSTGLSSNALSEIRKPRAAIDPRVPGICASCWMRVAKNSTVRDLGAQARNTPVAC
jgi:hypothetical protein